MKLCQSIRVLLGFNGQDEETGSHLAVVQTNPEVLTQV